MTNTNKKNQETNEIDWDSTQENKWVNIENNTRDIISCKIIDILENQVGWEYSYEEWSNEEFEQQIKDHILKTSNQVNDENIKSVYKQYFSPNEWTEIKDKETIDKNIPKYLQSHLSILLSYIKNSLNEIDKFSNRNSEKAISEMKKRQIDDALLKYTYIIYTYWDNITEDKLKESLKYKKPRTTVASKILWILDDQNFWTQQWDCILKYEENDTIQIEQSIKRFISNNFRQIEGWDKLSVFEKYSNKDESTERLNTKRMNQKFEKYFPVHLRYILNDLQWKIHNLTNQSWYSELTPEEQYAEKENIISNTLRVYTYIIFILWEKIKVWELCKFLKLDIKNIRPLNTTVSANIKSVDNAEQKYIDKKRVNIERFYSGIGDISEELINDKFLATTYRNSFKKIKSKEENITLIGNYEWVEEEIEKVFTHQFKNLFSAFTTWCNSELRSDENLLNFEIVANKIMNWIDIFKSESIAFTENINERITKKTRFINDVMKVLWSQIDEWESKELFKTFISLSLEAWWKEKYNELIEKIIDIEKHKNKLRAPEALVWQDEIDLQTINFDSWQKVPQSQKYKLLFTEILWKDWKINISEYLEMKNIDVNLLKIFTDYHDINYQIVHDQFGEINRSENMTIEEFINNDINNFYLIIKWWRFILTIRKLESEWKEISEENIEDIKENQYGFIENIVDKFAENWLLDSKKLKFTEDWKLNNDSVETIEERLKWIFRWLKNWTFDLSKTEIDQSWEPTLLKELTKLYIPDRKLTISDFKKELKLNEEIEDESKRNVEWKYRQEYKEIIEKIEKIRVQKNKIKASSSPEDKKEYDRLKDEDSLYKEFLDTSIWLESWIDVCFNILKKREITDLDQLAYLNQLFEMNIVPKNLSDMSIKDYESIQELVETLKYIKSTRCRILKMIIKWNDAKILLGNIVDPEQFWPQKWYKRAFEKYINTYSWNSNQLTDLARGQNIDKHISYIQGSIYDFCEKAIFDDNVIEITFRDMIWEPIRNAQKKTWYRDFKVFLKLANWTVSEHQFHQKSMHDLKEEWVPVDELIISKMKKEKNLFTTDDYNELFRVTSEKNIDLPTIKILEDLLLEWSIYWLIEEFWIDEERLSIEEISANYTYKLSQAFDQNSALRPKFKKLEKIMADYEWTDPTVVYLKEILTPLWVRIK